MPAPDGLICDDLTDQQTFDLLVDVMPSAVGDVLKVLPPGAVAILVVGNLTRDGMVRYRTSLANIKGGEAQAGLLRIAADVVSRVKLDTVFTDKNGRKINMTHSETTDEG